MPSNFVTSGNIFLAPHIKSRIAIQPRTGRNTCNRVCNDLSDVLLSTGMSSCTEDELVKKMGNDHRRARAQIDLTVSGRCITRRSDGRIAFCRKPPRTAASTAETRHESDIFNPPKTNNDRDLHDRSQTHNRTCSGALVRPSNPPPKSVDGGVNAAQARPVGEGGTLLLAGDNDALCDEIAVMEAKPQPVAVAPKPAPPPKPEAQPKPAPKTSPRWLTPAAGEASAIWAQLNAARAAQGLAPLPDPSTPVPESPAAAPEPSEDANPSPAVTDDRQPPDDASPPPKAAQPRQPPADGMSDAQRFQRHLEHMGKDFVPIQGPPEPLTEHACEQVAAIDPALNHPRSAAQWLRDTLHQAGVSGQLLQRGVLAYRHQLSKQVIHYPLSYIRKAALNQRALQLKHEASGGGG